MLYDLPLTDAVPMDIRPFAKPRHGEKPRVLFVNGVKHGREIAQLMQLQDMHVTNVTFDRAWDLNKWGFGDFYDLRGDAGNQAIMLDNLLEALMADVQYDCIVLPVINGWRTLTDAIQKAIEGRVREGTGLFFISPMEGEGDANAVPLASLSPLVETEPVPPFTPAWYDRLQSGPWHAEGQHYITHGIPFSLLPGERLASIPYHAEGEVLATTESGRPLLATRQVGKGRVAAIGYYSRDILPQHKAYRGMDGCFNPIIDTWLGAGFPYDHDFMTLCYRLVARVIDWCAGKETDAPILSAQYDRENGTVSVQHAEGQLHAEVWDAHGACLMENTPVETPFPLPTHAVEAGGRYRMELTLMRGENVCDFYTLDIDLPQATSITATLSDDVRVQGDTLVAHVSTEGPADQLIVGLVDDYGRLLAVQSAEPDKSAVFTFVLEDVLACHVHAEAVALRAGTQLARARSENCVVTPSCRKLTDFEVLMNPQNRGQGDLLLELSRKVT